MMEFLMPKMDHMTEECMIAQWLVQPGDKVETGQIIVEIETAKSVLEVEANFAGTVQELLVPEGETVPVHTPIALIKEA